MALSTAQTATGAALIAALLGSVGGTAFLKKHPDPNLRLVYQACEQGEITGIVCCEDVGRVTDPERFFDQCGMISPGNVDPFRVRDNEENAWDEQVAKEKEEAKK